MFSEKATKKLNPNCTCPKASCRRHGDCKACKKHHGNNLTFCKIESLTPEDMNLYLKKRGRSHSRKRSARIAAKLAAALFAVSAMVVIFMII